MLGKIKKIVTGTLLGKVLATFALMGISVLVYRNALDNGFVWDDHILLTQNLFVQDWSNVKKLLSWDYFFRYPPLDIENGARPLWVLSALLDFYWWGFSAMGHHFSNLMLHALNSALVFALASLFLSFPLAFVAGLFFAVHPVHSEVVAVVGFRADLLCTLFFLLAFVFYRAASQMDGFVRRYLWQGVLLRASLLLGSLACYFLGLFSKEMAATLPAVIVLHDLYWGGKKVVFRRVPVYGFYALCLHVFLVFQETRSHNKLGAALQSLTSQVISWLSFTTPAQAASVVTLTESPAAAATADALTKVLTMATVFAQYIRLMVWPWPLRAEYEVHVMSRVWDPWVLVSLALLGGVGALIVLTARPHKVASFSLAAFFVALIPVSQALPMYNLMAERYLYLPSVFFCVFLAWGLGEIQSLVLRSGRQLSLHHLGSLGPWGVPVMVVMLVSVWSGVASYRTSHWQSDSVIWQVTSEQSPGVARVWYNRAVLSQAGTRLKEAETFYRRAIEIEPNYIEARTNLAGLLARLSREEEAIAEYQSLIAQEPDISFPYMNLANLYMKRGEYQQAVGLYQFVRGHFGGRESLAPANTNLGVAYAFLGDKQASASAFRRAGETREEVLKSRFDLAKSLDSLQRYEEAEGQLRRILKLKPDWVEAHVNLGAVLLAQGKRGDSIAVFKKTLELDPDHPAAHFNMGVAYGGRSDFDMAEFHYRAAIGALADYDDAYYNLAVIYQRQNKIREAMELYEKVIEIRPSRVEAISNLGGCYSLLGGLDMAEKYSLMAIQVDPGRSAPRVNLGSVYFKRGDYAKAMESFQEAIQIDPLDGMAYNNLGVCFLKQGEMAKAEKEFTMAIRVSPGLPDAHFHLGKIFYAQGRRTEAVYLWKKVLQLNPNHSGARQQLRNLSNGS